MADTPEDRVAAALRTISFEVASIKVAATQRVEAAEAELARLRAVSDFNAHPNAPDPDGAVYRVMERKLADVEAELARLKANRS